MWFLTALSVSKNMFHYMTTVLSYLMIAYSMGLPCEVENIGAYVTKVCYFPSVSFLRSLTKFSRRLFI